VDACVVGLRFSFCNADSLRGWKPPRTVHPAPFFPGPFTLIRQTSAFYASTLSDPPSVLNLFLQQTPYESFCCSFPSSPTAFPPRRRFFSHELPFSPPQLLQCCLIFDHSFILGLFLVKTSVHFRFFSLALQSLTPHLPPLLLPAVFASALRSRFDIPRCGLNKMSFVGC